jgi:hypothetical protein
MSFLLPSQAVITGTIFGLVILLVVAQLVDYEGSRLKNLSRVVTIFSTPLLVWFAFNILIQIARIIGS